MSKKQPARTAEVESFDSDEPKEIQIESPEQWPEATAVRGVVTIKSPRGLLRFDVCALSYTEWERIFEQYANPKPPKKELPSGQETDDLDSEAYKDGLLLAGARRRVAVIDCCWKKLPGETIDAKIAWVAENMFRDGDLPKLYDSILRFSGFGLAETNRHSEKPVVVVSPEDWAKQTMRPMEFRIVRGSEVHVFSLRGINGAKYKSIVAQTQPPEPPVKPRLRPDGRRGDVGPDLNDPTYKAQVRKMSELRAILVLESALPFQIPGETPEQKIEWLGKRAAGEVNDLENFVQHEVANVRERADFFSGA